MIEKTNSNCNYPTYLSRLVKNISIRKNLGLGGGGSKCYRVEKPEAQTSKLDKPGSDPTLSLTRLRLREQILSTSVSTSIGWRDLIGLL